jgi:hypothetical protein
MMKRLLTVLLVLSFVSSVAAIAPAEAKKKRRVERSVSSLYGPDLDCHAMGPQGQNTVVNLGCIFVYGQPGERFLDLTIEDRSGLPVYAEIYVDGNGDHEFKSVGEICGSTKKPIDVSSREGAGRPREFEVLVWLPIEQGVNVACNAGLTGYAHFTFSNLP